MAIIPNTHTIVSQGAIEKAAAAAKQEAAKAEAAAAEAIRAAKSISIDQAAIDADKELAKEAAAESAESAATSLLHANAAAGYRDQAQGILESTGEVYSATQGVLSDTQSVYSDTQSVYEQTAELYSQLDPVVTVIADNAYVQETATSADDPDTIASRYIKEVVEATFADRGVRMISCGAYSDGAPYSTFDSEPMGSASSFPVAMLAEDAIFRHELTSSYSSVSYSQLVVKKFATAELWIEIPASDSFSGQIAWPAGQWLEGAAPSSLETGQGHIVVLRNVGGGANSLLMNYACSYSLSN